MLLDVSHHSTSTAGKTKVFLPLSIMNPKLISWALFLCLGHMVCSNRLSNRNRLLEDTPYRVYKSPLFASTSPQASNAPESSPAIAETSSPRNVGVIRSTDAIMLKRYPKHGDAVPMDDELVDDDSDEMNKPLQPHHHHHHHHRGHHPSNYRMYKGDQGGIGNSLQQQQQLQCSSPDQRKGICYEASECIDRGGIPMGACGAVGSVCCLFEATCGQAVAERHVYFRSNHLIGTSPEASQFCRLKVNKMRADVCQLRLTFETFDIAKPIEGNCSQDIFSVTGQNENFIVPRICGLNTGQHYYIGVDESGLINLQFMLRGQFNRKWNIHVEQLACDSRDLAPPHCLQYYEGTQGTIKSFNYDSHEGRDSSPSTVEGYPNNIDYIVCIRKETGFCSIAYEFMSDSSGGLWPFSVGPTAHGTSGGLMMGEPDTGREGPEVRSMNNCDDDYLVVGGMRLCSRIVSFSEHDEAMEDERASTGSSTLPNSGSTLTPSDEIGSMDIANGTNGAAREAAGELFESSGASQPLEMERDETLRRPHRRANQHSRLYYDEPVPSSAGQGRRMASLRGNRVAPATRSTENARGSPHHQHHLMAIDSTPGPFLLRFVANGVKNAKGFYLSFRQNPCKV